MQKETSHNINGIWVYIKWENEKVGYDQRGHKWLNQSAPVPESEELLNAYLDATNEAQKKMNALKQVDNSFSDHISQTIEAISKAGAYDAIAPAYAELKERYEQLKEYVTELIKFGELEEMDFTDGNDTIVFQSLITKIKAL